jgi:putative ABC transport system permease protein
MKFKDRNRIALGALVRYPMRTTMMLIATAIGVAAVLVLTSLGEAARRFVTSEFRSLGTHLVIVIPGRSETTGAGPALFSGETPRDLTVADARALLRTPKIEKVAPVMIGAASVSWGGLERDVTIMGTTASLLEIRNWQMALGAFLPEVDMDRASPVCVIGETVRKELFRNTSPLGQWLRVGDRRCRVTGVMATAGRSVGVDVDDIVIIPVASALALFNSPGLFRIIVQAAGREAMPAAKREIARIIAARHHGEEDVTVITQDAVLETFDGIFNALSLALAGLAAISLVVAGVLIMNVMLVAVSQRTGEIGLFKALGARRRQITALFLTEAVFLASLGAVAGLALGYLAVAVLQRVYPTLEFVPPAWAVLGAVLVAIASGVLFGILPARRAARLDPIAALAGR